jgi:hypothetical protein
MCVPRLILVVLVAASAPAASSLPAHLQHLSERHYIHTDPATGATTFISEAEQRTQQGRWFTKMLSSIKDAVVGTFSSSDKTTKARANVDGGIESPSGDGGDIGGDDPWVPQLGDKGGWFTTTDKGKKVRARVSVVVCLRQFIPVSVSISIHMYYRTSPAPPPLCPSAPPSTHTKVYISGKAIPWKKMKKSLPPSTYARLWDIKMKRGEEFILATANHNKRAATSGSHSGGTGETEADCYARLSKHQARYIHATKNDRATHITRLAKGAPPPLKSTFKALCHSNADVKAVAYTGFEVWESCAVRGAFRFAYDVRACVYSCRTDMMIILMVVRARTIHACYMGDPHISQNNQPQSNRGTAVGIPKI